MEMKLNEVESSYDVNKKVGYEVESISKPKTRPYEVIALISFILCFVSLILAIIFDFSAFKNVILQFIAALIIPIIVFIMLTILFLVSFILIFGFFLVKTYGFWPLNISVSLFKEIIGEIEFKPDDIQQFRIYRYILLGLCIAILVGAIASKIMKKVDYKKLNITPNKASGKFSTTAIVLSTLGIMVSIGALVIFSRM